MTWPAQPLPDMVLEVSKHYKVMRCCSLVVYCVVYYSCDYKVKGSILAYVKIFLLYSKGLVSFKSMYTLLEVHLNFKVGVYLFHVDFSVHTLYMDFTWTLCTLLFQ